jgi:polar amino acid transport system permease protein
MIESVLPYVAALTRGLLVTLVYFAIGAAGSLILALPVALGVRSAHLAIRAPSFGYVEFFRNTPLLVQLFWLHFALPTITGFTTTAPQTAAIAIVLVMTAYMAEVYRAGIGGVPKGQYEAAISLGLGTWKSWMLIVLPQAARVALPAIGNTLVSLFKATSILSILAVPEFMRTTSRISDYTADPITFYTIAAVVYVAIGLLLSAIMATAERHLRRRGAS